MVVGKVHLENKELGIETEITKRFVPLVQAMWVLEIPVVEIEEIDGFVMMTMGDGYGLEDFLEIITPVARNFPEIYSRVYSLHPNEDMWTMVGVPSDEGIQANPDDYASRIHYVVSIPSSDLQFVWDIMDSSSNVVKAIPSKGSSASN